MDTRTTGNGFPSSENRSFPGRSPSLAREKWYQAGLCFSCTQCGNCCSGEPGYVWVTKKDIARIAEFLGREDGRLDEHQVRRVGFRYSLTEKPNGDCIFLVRHSGQGPNGPRTSCAIHPVRPLQCRTWPFWTQNLRTADDWNRAHQKCPGMNTGRHYDFVQIESLRTDRK
jgi:Fe-S-cluster containining protein